MSGAAGRAHIHPAAGSEAGPAAGGAPVCSGPLILFCGMEDCSVQLMASSFGYNNPTRTDNEPQHHNQASRTGG